MTATTPATARPPVPEQGGVVDVRGSTWAVTDVREQGLPRSAPDDSSAELQHVVTLQSLSEDRLGDELAVVWELEVGHSIAPDQGLHQTIDPDGFDDPNTLGAFVDAVRWGAVTSADETSYQAPFRSGATVEAYQLEPLRRALASARTNLLLADDVGLGKTIEAGLVVQELLLRHRARTVMVVCPPSLSLKWQAEMREKFGLEFTVVDSELLARVRRTHGIAANPFRLFPRLIVSLSWLPTPRAQRLVRPVLADAGRRGSARRYAYDVLIVDEAHHVAPANPTDIGRARGYAVDSQRTLAVRDLAAHCEHRLFLSATPHNGATESFTALLEMIDDRRFARGADVDPAALAQVAVRRLKSDIPEKGFKQRTVMPIPFEPTDEEQRHFAELDRLLTESARRNAGHGGTAGDLVGMLLKKRFLSSPYAFGLTMDLYTRAPARGRLPEDLDAYGDEVLWASDEEEGRSDHPELVALRQSKASDPLSAASQGELERLAAWGRSYEGRPDARLAALLTFLDGVCRSGKLWTNERVVVFTEYAATLDWLRTVLESRGYQGRLATIQGSTPPEERERIRAQFTADPNEQPVRVLVATDSAGEGIDLQSHCHRLVNFDIPFNPSRLEQRIGRIDRYGQTETPQVFHLVPVASSSRYAADIDFVARVAHKIATVRADLGSANEIVAHFSGRPRPAPRRRRPDRAVLDALGGDRNLARELTELARTFEARRDELHIRPRNARRVLDTALALTAQPGLTEVGDDRTDAQVFRVPALGDMWRQAVAGLDTTLKPGVPRPITFDQAAARDDLVGVHLGHPLLAKASRLLRAALFSSASRLHRATAVVVDDLDRSSVAVVSRLVLVGRGGLRLHEEVFLTGIRLGAQAMAEEKIETLLEQALDHDDLVLAPEGVRDHLAGLWNAEGSRLRVRLDEAMRARAEQRQQRVRGRLDARRASDEERAGAIFGAFRDNLVRSLRRMRAEDEQGEAMLFGDDAREQRRKDMRAMEQRLDSLADEGRRELDAIADRYADVKPHVSAAAVLFAVTPDDADRWGRR